MTTLQTVEYEYRKDIDGLRAIAVVAVIINHLSHGALPGGYLGVDIFFVISGYVITSSLEKRRILPWRPTPALLFRRNNRLVPALLTMVFVTTAVIQLLIRMPKFRR